MCTRRDNASFHRKERLCVPLVYYLNPQYIFSEIPPHLSTKVNVFNLCIHTLNLRWDTFDRGLITIIHVPGYSLLDINDVKFHIFLFF